MIACNFFSLSRITSFKLRMTVTHSRDSQQRWIKIWQEKFSPFLNEKQTWSLTWLGFQVVLAVSDFLASCYRRILPSTCTSCLAVFNVVNQLLSTIVLYSTTVQTTGGPMHGHFHALFSSFIIFCWCWLQSSFLKGVCQELNSITSKNAGNFSGLGGENYISIAWIAFGRH